ncbi:MAG: hypothetical protein IID28_15430 [Planctomycetes bacterium]|nr:hypothetical protein [Planctomycetota bacterium]
MTPQVGTACQDGTGGPGDRETARGGVRTAARPLELRQWATWLRLNAPRQARGAFRRRQRDGTMHVCAIGALEEIGAGEAPILFCPLNEATFIRKVRVMNDSHGWTFPQIADPDKMVYSAHSIIDGTKNPLEPVYLLKDVRQMTKDFHQLMRDFQAFIGRLPPS